MYHPFDSGAPPAGYGAIPDEVEYDPYHDGQKSSFCSNCIICLFGVLLFPAAIGVLAWNEKNTVCEANKIMQVEQDAKEGSCGAAPASEGQITFFSCPVEEKSLEDWTPMSSFNTPGLAETIKYHSVVGAQKIEMFQCIESKKAPKEDDSTSAKASEMLGGGSEESALEIGSTGILRDKHNHTHGITRREDPSSSSDGSSGGNAAPVYSYRMGWASVYYNSKEFKATPEEVQKNGCPDFLLNGQVNHNPEAPDRGDGEKAALGKESAVQTKVIAGGFTFADYDTLHAIQADTRISLAEFRDKFTLSETTDNIIRSITPSTVAVHAGKDEYLNSCAADRLGCLRISYYRSDVTHMSVLGMGGAGGVIWPIKTKGFGACKSEEWVKMYPKAMTKDEMIKEMKKELASLTWAYRIGGLVACWFGLYCCFHPIGAASDVMGDVISWIPCFGRCLEKVLEGVVESFLCLCSCGIGLALGLFTIAAFWAVLRPNLGGPIVALGLFLCCCSSISTYRSKRDPKRMKNQKKMEDPYAQQQAYYGKGGMKGNFGKAGTKGGKM